MEGRPFKRSFNRSVRQHFGRRSGSPRAVPGQEFSLRRRAIFRLFAILLIGISAFLFIINSANAQVGPERPARVLITQGINEGQLVTLRGNTRPEADSGNDHGTVANELPMEHMLLLLRRPPEQELGLQQFIDKLETKGSPEFHHWITAQQFGERFGLAQQDLGAITGWLESNGFKVNVVYPSGTVIDFSGTAGQVRRAFHTEVHNLEVNGEKHVANMSDPQIPAALAPAVVGIVSLHDFRPHPQYKMRTPHNLYTASNGEYLLVPGDLATIYNMNPLFAAGYSGQGQTIALIEDTDLYSTADWTTFRSTFGLSSYTSGSLTTVHPAPQSGANNCTAPGLVGTNEGEAILDAEWASAAAPNAAVEMATCKDTSTTFGGLIAVQNLVNAATQPAIMSISYGECEIENGLTANAAYNSAYQQAVAEGVSVYVSAGDSGAAGCDQDESAATHGIAVNAFASTPYDVAVGGTDFSDTYTRTNSTYWGSSNTSNYASARSYIPEIPWNDSCAGALLASFEGGDPVDGAESFCNLEKSFETTAAGGGGPSSCAVNGGGSCVGYAKPSWQTVFGNPCGTNCGSSTNDGVRDLPDVSLFAANGIWSHYYVFCFSDTGNGGAACTGSPSGWAGAGGTSFASPIMAGVQALVNQKTGSRQGNPNPVYYQLASAEYGATGSSSCNSSQGNGVAGNCIFYDVTQGDMDVNCTYHSTNCYDPGSSSGNRLPGVLSTSDSSYLPAYGTTTGWDFATGLGTVNVANLVNNWPSSIPNLAGMWDLRLSNTSNPPSGQDGETEFVFDVEVQSSSGSTETFSNNGFQDLAFGNSVCLASGTDNNVTMTETSGASTTVTFQISVDNGGSYSMTGTLSANGTTITGTNVQYSGGSTNCGGNDDGSGFTAILYKPATGTYAGSFTPDASGAPFSATIALTEDSEFNLTGTVTGTGNSCFSNLTVNGNTDPSFATGNILDFFGTDSRGDIVGFLANAGGSNDNSGDTTWQSLYVTAVVYGGACNGQTYSDAPFHRVGGRPRRPAPPRPVRRRWDPDKLEDRSAVQILKSSGH